MQLMKMFRAAWDDPVKGNCTDVFVMSDDGTMFTAITTSKRHSTNKTVQYKTTYRRAA
jgi:hypothetical protein